MPDFAPKRINNWAIKPIRSIMLGTLDGEARKQGTWRIGKFQLHTKTLG